MQTCGMPSWVTDKTIPLKLKRDEAKTRYMISDSKQFRERWWRLKSSLNESYKADKTAMLNKGEYTTTWEIIHDLLGKNKKSSVKVLVSH